MTFDEIDDALPPGNWRIDPFTRVLRFIPDNPEAVLPDAFDAPEEPLEETPRFVDDIKHGTEAGARAHTRRKRKVCTACRNAERAKRAEREAARAAAGDALYKCECGNAKARTSVRCKTCAIRTRWGYAA